MSKHQKQQILEFISSLWEAHKEIQSILEYGKIQKAQTMLCDCQEYAIELGNIIESFEGEKVVTISYIEKYCELLYHYYEKLNIIEEELEENKKAFIKIVNILNKQLSNMENSIKNDIKEKKEVVFFPYKASMWDSLESVYLAAKEDENCDAYCVPIPYYDKNPDGSLGKMHYEGREYPKNIEVIDWKTYDFKERRPDVVYIHNPYDECNYVTCVHEDYFARNLKKYTDQLVYIPYFVINEIDPKDQTSIDGMKHFCFLPGTIYADKVILQSENMRQIYINEYSKAARSQGHFIDRGILEKKFLGTGSPKLDKVRNSNLEDVEIPNEWLKIIQKPDGNRKKVIFYNTSIAALLENREEMLEKIKYVLHTFKEEQEEVALLWRPHPLIESTIKSMLPHLWREYSKIVEQYKQEGWGVYDDTVDLNRAIVISDAYYGDSSSVVQLYQETGKPLLYEMPYIREGNRRYQDIEFENLYEDEEYFWFTSYHFNGLFKMDKSEWKPQFVGVFPNEELAGFRLYSKIVEYENKLYFTPLRAKEIAIYDKENNIFYKIAYEELNIGYLTDYSGWNFYDAQLYEDNIYFFPHQRTSVLQYDLKNKKLKEISKWVSGVINKYDMSQPRVFYRTEMNNGIVYAPVSGCNLLECINLNTMEMEIYEIGKKGSTYSDICISGRNGYVCPFEGEEIIEWDIIEKKEKKAIPYLKNKKRDICFQGVCKQGKRIYIFPEYYENVIEINSDNGEIEKTSENLFDRDYHENYKFMNSERPMESRYTFCCESKGSMYAYCYATRRLFRYGKGVNKVGRVIIDCMDKKNKEYIKQKCLYSRKIFEDRKIIQLENSAYDVGNFLNCIICSDSFENI